MADLTSHHIQEKAMHAQIMTVTPEQASEWLDVQHHNRPLTGRLVTALRRAIDDGHWVVTGQGISFDDDGRLVDGQHRLTAIVLSGKSVKVLCCFGVPREAAMTWIDQGKVRTNADAGAMLEEKNSTEKAAILRAIWVATHGGGLTDKFLPHVCWNEVMPKWRIEVERVIHSERNAPGFTSAVLGGLALTLRMPRGDDFVAGSLNGAELGKKDPRLALRSAFGGAYGRSVRRGNQLGDAILRVTSAADVFQRGEEIGHGRLVISVARYKRFCEVAHLPVNQALVSYAENGR